MVLTWERKESQTKPGQFFYFCKQTGANTLEPPLAPPPWKILESKSKRGQYYYFNEVTGENSVDPPSGAKAVEKKELSATKEGAPNGWTKKESSSYKGKYYY